MFRRKQALSIQAQPAPTRISNLVPPTSKFRPTQALLIQAQPAPTRISNLTPPTSKFRKDCKCFSELSTALTLLTQALPIQVPVPQAPTIQASPATESPIQSCPTSVPLEPLALVELGREQLEKHLEQVHIASTSDICFPIDKCTKNDANVQLFQYAASRQKEILGLFKKSCLVEQTDNEKDKKLVLTELPTIQRAYIQSTSDLNRDFYI